MEREENIIIPFVDILMISKRNGGLLSHQVYQNKTHINMYLHANSHHHPIQNLGVINTLVAQAIIVLDNDHIEQELRQLGQSFQKQWL
jgi:hypothetical protein